MRTVNTWKTYVCFLKPGFHLCFFYTECVIGVWSARSDIVEGRSHRLHHVFPQTVGQFRHETPRATGLLLLLSTSDLIGALAPHPGHGAITERDPLHCGQGLSSR